MKKDKCEEPTESGLKIYVVRYRANSGLIKGFALLQAYNTDQIKGLLRAESDLNSYNDIEVLSIEEILYSITPKLIVEAYHE